MALSLNTEDDHRKKGLRRPSDWGISGGLKGSHCGYPAGYSDSKQVAMKVSLYMA